MKQTKKLLAFALAFIMLAFCFAGCADKGQPLLKVDNVEISVNIFELYLSRMKGNLSVTLGERVNSDSFWDTLVDVYDKTTYNTKYTEEVLDSAKTYAAALALFEEKGLSLSDSEIKEIDERLEEMVATDGGGSKSAFNAIIGQYGVNYEMLREAYIIENKIVKLRTELFGSSGTKIGANLVEDYFQKNYVRFKQIFLPAYAYEYITDRNGDVMYFKDGGKTAYNTNMNPKIGEDGVHLKDESGSLIYTYITVDGKEKFAYDTVNGKPEYLVDDDGNPKIRKYNDVEMGVLRQERDEIMSQLSKDDSLAFDILSAKHNGDENADKYPNGYYITKDTNYDAPEVIEKVFSMAVGDVGYVHTDYGIHILMRCALEEGAYSKSEYKEMFVSEKTGTYYFMDSLKNELMTAYLEPYKARVSVDTELYKTVDIKRAGINLYY